VRACADGYAERDAIVHLSRELGFLTGEEPHLYPLALALTLTRTPTTHGRGAAATTPLP
jgi:hypothetical protein